MPKSWRSRGVSIVLPRSLVLTMFDRARRYDVDEGGRFDARSAVVMIWSGQLGEHGRESEPIGSFYVHWHTPTDDRVTLWKLEWDPDRGSEAEVWAAIDVLAGQPVPRS